MQAEQDRLVDDAARLIMDGVDGRSEDTEIDFHPRHGRDRSDSLYFGSPEVDAHHTNSHSNERDRLEVVETAVHDMNQKFDCLLASLAGGVNRTTREAGTPHARHARLDTEVDARPRPPPAAAARSTAPRADHARLRLLQELQGRDTAQVPRTSDFKGPLYDDYIREQIHREDFLATRNDDGKGIVSDIYIKALHPKPYMYLERPGLSTVRKRLDARQTMTYQEYILAYIKMIRDPRADQSHLVYYHLEHLQQMAEDALKRDWQAVRGWSQAVLDDIEKGSYNWADTQLIQIERLNHAVNYQRAAGTVNTGPPHSYNLGERTEGEPCRDYNSDRGCHLGKTHGSGANRQIHSCTYCYTQTGKYGSAPRHCYHDVSHCRRREADMGQAPATTYRPPGGSWFQGAPKNGR